MTLRKAPLAAAALGAAFMLPLEAAAQDGWTPERAVEFVVPYSPGGGSDINARALADAIQKNDLMDQNLLVVNKPGGSGAVGNAYVASQAGEGGVIMTFNSGQMMSTISNDASVTLEDLTPLGTLALDTLVLAVDADSEAQSFADLAEAAAAEPQSVTIGGAARGSEDNLIFEIVNQETGGNLQYVPFDGSGATLAALLGGHIDAGVFNPSEVGAQIEAGELRALGTFSEERLQGALAETPTFVELGYPEATFVQFRGYAGPGDMPPEAVAYWEDVLTQAAETEEWRSYVENEGLVPASMGAEESRTFWEKENARYRELLGEMGFIN